MPDLHGEALKRESFFTISNEMFKSIGRCFRGLATANLATLPTTVNKPLKVLRPYQLECIDTCVRELKAGNKRHLAVSIATGGGKTFVFTKLIPQLASIPNGSGKGILILVHRKELAEQAIRSMRACRELHDYPIFLEMANSKLKEDHLASLGGKPFVVVASVPTVARSEERLNNLDPELFQTVIVDECHHAVSRSYLKVLDHFGCLGDDNTGAFLLGFSATLERHDGKPLDAVFDEIVYEKSMIDLIDEGYLVDCDWRSVQAGFNLKEVAIGWDGDYALDSLARHVDTPEINQLALRTYKYFLENRSGGLKSTLVFCCNVQHMINLRELFRMNGISAEYVAGTTNARDRSELVKRFKQGEIQVLMNCGVFTEGTDLPNIDSILLLRPTRSKPLLTQMVGRGLRLDDDKDRCLIVDFVEGSGIGITLSGDLGGHKVPNPLGGLFAGTGGGLQGHDIPLEKQPDYVEFKSFEGFKELVKEWEGADNEVPMTIQVRKAVARSPDGWIQTKRNSWAFKMDDTHHYRIDTDNRAGKVTASYVMLVPSSKNPEISIPRTYQVMSGTDPLEALAKISEHITQNKTRALWYEIRRKERRKMESHDMTPRQRAFLLRAIGKCVNPSKQCRVDLGKFHAALEKELQRTDKYEAYNLIFAYTVTHRKALQVWVSGHLINTKEKRLALMISKEAAN